MVDPVTRSLSSAGPRQLASSPDGAWLACADGETLTLLSAHSARTVATRPLLSGALRMGFVGGQLVVTTCSEERTVVEFLTLPELEADRCIELDRALRIAATAGRFAVLAGPEGESPVVLEADDEEPVFELLVVREPLGATVGLDRNTALLLVRGRLEAWDLQYRRPKYRLNLPISPSPRDLGIAGGYLWVVSGDEARRFEGYRLSDGRLVCRWNAKGPIKRATSHPAVPLVALAVGGDEQTLLTFNMTADKPAPTALDAAGGDAMAVVGARPLRVALAHSDGTVTVRGVDDAAPVALATGDAAPARADQRARPPADGDAPPTRAEARRDAGAGRDAPPADRAPPPADRDDAAGDELPDAYSAPHAGERAPGATEPSPTRQPSVGERMGQWRARMREGRVAPPASATEPAEAPGQEAWRHHLVAWGAAALASPGNVELPPWQDDSPLTLVTRRLGLLPPAYKALALLYANRLLGHDRRGVAAADLARVVGDDAGWWEALGRGELAAAGVARPRDGRVKLVKAVARYLDGRPPRHLELLGGPAAGGRAPPVPSRLAPKEADDHAAEDPADAARRVATSTADLALLDLRARPERFARRLRAGLLEADLRDLVPVLIPPAGAEVAWRELPRCLIAADDRDPALAALPVWEAK